MILALQALLYFRESVFHLLHRLLRPYYDRLAVGFRGEESDDEEVEVFAEWDEERGVLFFPPVYLQRYAAVSDCLLDPRWAGKLEKVVELGYHDMSFMKYLKDIDGVKEILGVDMESAPLNCSSTWLETAEPNVKRSTPLNIQLLQGNAADYRLIGCDAVVSIEMIEHMLPHDLERLVHTVFGFTRPWVAVFTTPNVEFNVYFKGLKPNQLRRDDHFFEWTREQFNEWCSNIVSRYPGYAVTTRGVGPGPPGSARAGCCSQLALFHAREYARQRSLSPNSMALLSEAPNPHTFSQIIGTLDRPDSTVYCKESGTDLSSIISVSVHQLLHDAPSETSLPLVVHDKTVQCDIESERQRHYVMAHDTLDKILVPRREVRSNRVYEFEDVASSLNCSTFQVRKFSKQTQQLVWKNNDLAPYTNEVVEEISRLTKILNLDKSVSRDRFDGCLWKNINWADNAPYWNQYYSVVKQFTYPIACETEDSRLLDLLSNEISRQCDRRSARAAGGGPVGGGPAGGGPAGGGPAGGGLAGGGPAVPLAHLMAAVEHITADVDRVKDLLEWNGYEVENGTVVHTSLNAFDPSIYSGSRDKDNLSNAGSDVHWDSSDACSSLRSVHECGSAHSEDGSGMIRALEEKVHELLTMTNIRRFPSEIDNIVCRLMRMATSAGAEGGAPNRRWLQCKLYDLLTMKIRTIERRRNNPLLESGVKKEDDQISVYRNLAKFNEDKTAERIVDKYYHLVEPTVTSGMQAACNENYEENKSTTDIYGGLSSAASETIVGKYEIDASSSQQFSSEMTEPWPCDETVHTSSTLKCESSQSDTKTVTANEARIELEVNVAPNTIETNKKSPVYVIKSICSDGSMARLNHCDLTLRYSKTDIKKKADWTDSRSCTELVRTCTKGMMLQRKLVYEQKGKIPGSLIELCHPELRTTNNMDEVIWTSRNDSYGGFRKQDSKKNKFIEIVTEDLIEVVDLTSFNQDSAIVSMNNYNVIADTSNNTANNEFAMESANDSLYNNQDGDSAKLLDLSSQTLFLHDFNEPSTSKGVHHICTDAQCGPDATCPLPSPAVSQRNFRTISTGIRIVESSNKTPESYWEYEENIVDESLEHNVTSNQYKVSRNALNIMSPLYDAATANHMPITTLIVISNHEILSDDIATKENHFLTNELAEKKQQKAADKNACKNTLSKFSTPGNSVKTGNVLSGTKETNLVLTPSFKTKLPIRIKSVRSGSLTRLKRRIKGIPAANDAATQIIASGNNKINSRSSELKKLPKRISHMYSDDVMYQGAWQKNAPKTLCRNVFKAVHKKSKEYLKRKSTKVTVTKSSSVEIKDSNLEMKRSVTKVLREQANLKRIERGMLKSDVSKSASQKPIQKQSNTDKFPGKNQTLTTPQSLEKLATDISNNIISLNNKSGTLFKTKSPCDFPANITKNIVPNYLCGKGWPETTLQTIDLMDNDDTQFVNYAVFHNDITTKASGVSSPVIRNTSENTPSNNSKESIETGFVHESKITKEKRKPESSNKIAKQNIEEKCFSKNPITPKCSKRKISPTQLFNKAFNSKSQEKENFSPVLKKSKINLKSTKSRCFGINRDTFLAEIPPDNFIFPCSTKFHAITPPISQIKTTIADDKYQDKTLVDESGLGPAAISEPSNSKSFTIIDSQSDPVAIKHTEGIISSVIDDIVKRYDDVKSNIDGTQEINVQTKINKNYSIGMYTPPDMEDIIKRRLSQTKDDEDEFDSETVILNTDEKVITTIPEETFSELSFQETSLDHNIDFSILKDKLDALGNADVVNLEVKSVEHNCSTKELESLQSVSTCRMSDNYLADNEQSNVGLFDIDKPDLSPNAGNNDSGNDKTLTNTTATIFERKISLMNASCPLAAQAFSGFSVNMSMRAEQPDYVNLVDSETGSIAGVRRQTMSEEAMVSSSDMDSFESCLVVEEDSVVPEWLFQFINHRDSEIEAPLLVPVQMPIVEPDLDMNGNNVVEPGATAGAGDGCGVHSDTSATTTSSFDSSDTAQETESVIMDPPSLSPQRETQSSPAVVVTEPQDGDGEDATASTAPSRRRDAPDPAPLASDGEADVSSLETD